MYDERVNIVAPELFKVFPTAEKMAAAKQKDVENSLSRLFLPQQS